MSQITDADLVGKICRNLQKGNLSVKSGPRGSHGTRSYVKPGETFEVHPKSSAACFHLLNCGELELVTEVPTSKPAPKPEVSKKDHKKS